MRRLFLLAALSLMTMLVFVPAAMAQTDLYDCEDFDTQEQAQAVFNQDTSDPYGLDEDDGVDDGIACETLPSGVSEGAGYQYQPSSDTPNTRVTPDGIQYSSLPDVIPASPAPSTVTTALPATGGPSLLLPVAGVLLLGTGILTAGLCRRFG